MYEDWIANLAVAATTGLAVALCILTHYEGLLGLSRRLAVRVRDQRMKVFYAIVSLLFLHVAEIWIFGIAFWGLLEWPACGALTGRAHPLLDAVYFSAITFSTVGYGDMVPSGPVRLLAGTESLVGLVLITWSASFTYLEMERFWKPRG
ncbi:potassium channel family protein [Piscinibacter koreensis]|uniref:Two pore domain potassium channel family protein n=1 Tax=Piscinibacter koreensis TaxID=2742824 RepID=A0A7Y6NQ67_9BURK|nr:potassium channel family protein [Schlegelella koreensis]NUZ07332.1 two pore domain potassium channel family protein [Schlegelella koreensis]